MQALSEGAQAMDYEQFLNIVTEVGYDLLRNGAEIYRVEDSVERICKAYGIAEVGIFAISTCIFISIQDERGRSFSRVKRVRQRRTDLDKIQRLNALCREICSGLPPVEEIPGKLKEIEAGRFYRLPWHVAGYALEAFGFTLMFGGDIVDALIAAVGGALLRLLVWLLESWNANFFFVKIIGSMLGAAIPLLIFRMGFPVHTDKIIIGTLMNLVPGVALTNFMRDLMAEDFVSGLMKLTEALLIATGMALGTGIAVWLFRVPV